MENKGKIFKVAGIGVFAALVFISSWLLSFPIPVPVGPITRIHLGNAICLLAGFVLGPVWGGLAAGVGSMLYDLITPAYITSAPFTLIFKFLLAFVCGLIAYSKGAGGKNTKRNITAAIVGSLTYIVLYLTKSFVEAMLVGNALDVVLISVATKLAASSVNATLAVIASVSLCKALKNVFEKIGLTS